MTGERLFPESFRYYLVDRCGDLVGVYRARGKRLEPGDIVTAGDGTRQGNWHVASVLGCQATVAPARRDPAQPSRYDTAA